MSRTPTVLKPGEGSFLCLLAKSRANRRHTRELMTQFGPKLQRAVFKVAQSIINGGKGRGKAAEAARVLIRRADASNVATEERHRKWLVRDRALAKLSAEEQVLLGIPQCPFPVGAG